MGRRRPSRYCGHGAVPQSTRRRRSDSDVVQRGGSVLILSGFVGDVARDGIRFEQLLELFGSLAGALNKLLFIVMDRKLLGQRLFVMALEGADCVLALRVAFPQTLEHLSSHLEGREPGFADKVFDAYIQQ